MSSFTCQCGAVTRGEADDDRRNAIAFSFRDAAALGAHAGTHAATGKTMHSVFAHVYRVIAGRIIHYDQIADTWPMVAAARDS